MNKIEQQIKRFGKVDVWDIIRKTINSNEDFVAGLVRGQLMKGEDRDGNMPQYAKASYEMGYIEYKLEQGKIDSSTLPYMNLYDTGAFHKAIEVHVRDKYVEILSRDSKASKLEGKYGSQILVPNEDRLKSIIEFILPKVQQELKKQLGY